MNASGSKRRAIPEESAVVGSDGDGGGCRKRLCRPSPSHQGPIKQIPSELYFKIGVYFDWQTLQSCHKQTTTASLVSARYCIFPSIDNIEPHLKEAALKIIARLVNLPEDAEIISVKIEDRAVIRFTEEGLLNAAGVFARGSSASTNDD